MGVAFEKIYVPETFVLYFDMSLQHLWLCCPEAALLTAVLDSLMHRCDMQLEALLQRCPVPALSTAVPRLLVFGPDVPSQGRLEGEPGATQLANVVLELEVHRADVFIKVKELLSLELARFTVESPGVHVSETELPFIFYT